MISDALLIALMTALNAAINAVPTFVGAPPSVVNTVLAPIAAAQARIAILLTQYNSILAEAQGFAGIVAGAAPGVSAAALTSQLAANQQLSALYQLQALLGRMSKNLAAISDSENTITVAGGNLFQIAATEYGDATDWTTIAAANGITDPVVVGAETLIIPATADDSGGILQS